MHARPPSLIAVLSLLVACGAPVASPTSPTSSTSPTPPAAQSTAPITVPTVTPAGAAISPTPARTSPTLASPTPPAGAHHNADGSVRITMPTLFDFGSAGIDGVWGMLQYAGVERQVVRIDPETYEIETVVAGLPILPNPVAPIARNGYVWLVSWDKSSVTQYDADTGALIREIEVGLHPIEPFAALGDVWAINHHGDSVTRIDWDTGATRTVDLPGAQPLGITVVANDLLMVHGPSQTQYLVDPGQMELIGSYVPAECFGPKAVIEDELWVRRCEADEIMVVEPRTGEVLESFASRAVPGQPLTVDGNIWLPFEAADGAGSFGLVGLDLETRQEVGEHRQPADIREGSAFAAFDSWWRWGWEGLLRVPAATLREATR